MVGGSVQRHLEKCQTRDCDVFGVVLDPESLEVSFHRVASAPPRPLARHRQRDQLHRLASLLLLLIAA